MNGEKYLPIGTVVMLKGGTKRAMIMGFCSMTEENKQKIFDYSGCLYPEGVLTSNQTLLFDHEQIEKVYFTGFVDEEEIKFKTKLKELANNINKLSEVDNTDTVNEKEATLEKTAVLDFDIE